MCNIATSTVFQEGYSFDKLKTAIEDKIKEYFLELRVVWANENNLIVRISQIESRIMGITGVVDISNTTLNGQEGNLELGTHIESPAIAQQIDDVFTQLIFKKVFVEV